MEDIELIRLKELPIDDLQPLLEEGRKQGFTFLDRLVTGYVNGSNRFGKPGEALFGVYCDQRLIAIGGLNQDPYLQKEDVGRVRHVYVLSSWRKQGIGKRLVQRIIKEAKTHYRLLTLRTPSEQADRFYRAIGFKTAPEIQNASHHLAVARND
ncbi:MAG: GNAT family N-acetyltransferase [Ardenticatenaceae bacterium]